MEFRKGTDRIGQKLHRITSDLKRYFDKRMKLLMINTGEFISKWLAMATQRIAGAFLLLGGCCFLFVALAVYLESLLETPGLGFAIVSLPLFILGIMFLYLKPTLVFEELQDLFEAEVIEAVEQNEEKEARQLENQELTQLSNKDV